ncbi:MAG: aminopeptidase [Clostridium sp.]|jgi:aspartyl aminopeptidase|nr:aminopeptidase [Clostridium sp.]
MGKEVNIWDSYQEKDLKELEILCKEYREFLDLAKTERECVAQVVKALEAHGYKNLDMIGDLTRADRNERKLYRVWMNKTVVAFYLGEDDLTQGMNILGAHIDSPRLDLKQNPLYEDSGLAYLDTHYYGGVKKYQWVTLPLAIHGVVVKKDGSQVVINMGDHEDDPVFFISDLLIHLATEQLDKKGAKVIEGEALDVIVGSKPLIIKDDKTASEDGSKGSNKEIAGGKSTDKDETKAKEAVKAGVLDILKKQYAIEEDDFLSAELEIVPAGRAREAGLDRSMILAYGQDDRVCSFASLKAFLDINNPKRTACLMLSDKEEIGSVGATGMQSYFFENALAEVFNLTGSFTELALRRCLANCRMLSSDVSAAFDPTYASTFDKRNSAYLGKGLVFNKYTGARGKSGSNDANAEYMAKIRRILEDGGVHYQTAELGKVDAGGGGTIAYIMARYGMEVIDSGVAVLNMHAPWEATAKVDIYEAYTGYLVFAAWK